MVVPFRKICKKLIVDEIVRNGGDINTGHFPGEFSDVANAFKVELL